MGGGKRPADEYGSKCSYKRAPEKKVRGIVPSSLPISTNLEKWRISHLSARGQRSVTEPPVPVPCSSL